MSPTVTSVTVLPPYALHLTFEDGSAGTVDLTAMVHRLPTGVFAPLRDPARFAEVYVDRELGTIAWPNGADIDPDTLYAEAHAATR